MIVTKFTTIQDKTKDKKIMLRKSPKCELLFDVAGHEKRPRLLVEAKVNYLNHQAVSFVWHKAIIAADCISIELTIMIFLVCQKDGVGQQETGYRRLSVSSII